ncbi:MAG: hypothetical protein QF570_09440 [Myxococcota bacterium]|nr:hypothetical protein [Myxococcota bacterium]
MLRSFGTLVSLAFAATLASACAMVDATIPVDEDQAAARDLAALADDGLGDQSVADLQRWSRLTKEGREHIIIGRYSDAEEALVEAFAVSQQFRKSDVRRRVSFGNLERLAARYRSDGADAAARRLLTIIAIESEGLTEFDYPKLSQLLVDLGTLEERRGNLEAAGRSYRRALDLRTEKNGANTSSLIEVYLKLAAVELQSDAATRTLEHATRALSLAETHVGERSPEVVEALLYTASANRALGNHATAEGEFHRALDLQRAIEGSTYTEAALLNGLATTQLETERLNEALASVDNALAILDLLKIEGIEHAMILDSKAQIYAAQGRSASAGALFDEVMLHVDAASPAIQRELFQSYEAFLVDENRLGEAKRVREQIEALNQTTGAAPAVSESVDVVDPTAETAEEHDVPTVSSAADAAPGWSE